MFSSNASRTAQFLNSLEEPDLNAQLPLFVRALPAKIAPDDIAYLYTKGALTLPTLPLQNALLLAYVEYVHPYMPLMDLHAFLAAVDSRDGSKGQISLFLYHAVMFAATAFVDMRYLREAGYNTRKSARKAFFQKTRVRPTCGKTRARNPCFLCRICSNTITSCFTILTMSLIASFSYRPSF